MSLPGRPCAEALRAVGHGSYRHGAIPAACGEPVACRVETCIENRVTQRREGQEGLHDSKRLGINAGRATDSGILEGSTILLRPLTCNDAAPHRSMSVPASTATSPAASLTGSGRRGGAWYR